MSNSSLTVLSFFSMSWKYIFKVGDREIEFVAGSESYLNDKLELVTRETCQKEKNKIIVSVSGSDIHKNKFVYLKNRSNPRRPYVGPRRKGMSITVKYRQ